MENILKNKKIIIIVSVAIVALICLAVALSGSRDITGTWVVAQRSVDESFRKYPEDDFVIYENGSFTSEALSIKVCKLLKKSENNVLSAFGVERSGTEEADKNSVRLSAHIFRYGL